MKYLHGAFIGTIIIASIGAMLIFFSQTIYPTDEHACTMDALICPDGSAVGRTGPECTFPACPELLTIPEDVKAMIDAKSDLIRVTTPIPGAKIMSPVRITGEARGYWFFEGSFPISIVNWDGLIIGEGIATADDEWMTEEFVPFTADITFTFDPSTPYNRGTLILRKDNPSGLSEHDDALEIPITF